jgi:type IV secretory pathway VirB10-like protein
VPTFEQTQQKWEDPAPYGEASNAPAAQNQQQNALKEPSLVFVRSVTQSSAGKLSNSSAGGDATPRLDLTPGTRIEAKLETQISSAVLTPVVAVVEYTYAIGDRIVIPSGARVYVFDRKSSQPIVSRALPKSGRAALSPDGLHYATFEAGELRIYSLPK